MIFTMLIGVSVLFILAMIIENPFSGSLEFDLTGWFIVFLLTVPGGAPMMFSNSITADNTDPGGNHSGAQSGYSHFFGSLATILNPLPRGWSSASFLYSQPFCWRTIASAERSRSPHGINHRGARPAAVTSSPGNYLSGNSPVLERGEGRYRENFRGDIPLSCSSGSKWYSPAQF